MPHMSERTVVILLGLLETAGNNKRGEREHGQIV